MKKPPSWRFFALDFRSFAFDSKGEAGFLARGGVLLDDAALCCLVDRLVGLGEGCLSCLRVGNDEFLNLLHGAREYALATHIKDVLLERCAVGFLCGRCDCHSESNSTLSKPYTQGWYYYGMIREIRGTVLTNEPGGVVVDVGGWGVFVYLAVAELPVPGAEISLKTHMAFRQDGVELYGFATAEDRRFFEQLLTVSGVGPKTALSIFSRGTRETLEGAIAKRDIDYLTRVIGLGKKAAEKLAIELSEKITVSDEKHNGADSEVFDTLVALGYTEREARKALASIPLHITGRDARLKAALSTK